MKSYTQLTEILACLRTLFENFVTEDSFRVVPEY